MVNDIDTISDGCFQGFTQLFSGLMTILGTIGFMLNINLGIGIMVYFYAPISVCKFLFQKEPIINLLQTRIKGEMGDLLRTTGKLVLIKSFSHEDIIHR